MKISHALFVVGLVVSGIALPHEDRILPIGADGTIANIPAKFGPAKMQVSFSGSTKGDAPISAIVLSLGSHRTRLPLCVTGLLLSQNIKQVRATGSWYHDESVMPYYLDVTFFDPGQDPTNWAASGYSLHFDLHNAKLLRMSVHIPRDNGQSVQEVPIDLAARCHADALKTFE